MQAVLSHVRSLLSLTKAAMTAVLAAIALAGCGTSQPPPISATELASAKTFPYFTLYWVGSSFAGSPLTAADGLEGYRAKGGDSLYYGDCVGSEDVLRSGGCMLPLRVSTSIYALHSNVDLGSQRNVVIRDVPAAIFNEGRAIELYTGRLMVEVYSNSATRALAATRLLRPLNAPGSDEGPLPPPVYCPQLAGSRPLALHRLMQRLPGQPCQLAKEALAQQRALKR